MIARPPEQTLPRDIRMALLNDNYISEFDDGGDGHFKAGDVLVVDEKTARRWQDKGIARPAGESDRTRREQKAAELARLKAEIEALEAVEAETLSGHYRELDPVAQVKARRGPGRPPGSGRQTA